MFYVKANSSQISHRKEERKVNQHNIQSEKKPKNKDMDTRELVFRLLYSSPPLIHMETMKSFGAFMGI